MKKNLEHENGNPSIVTRPEKRRRVLGAILTWARDLALSVLIAVVIILFLYQPVKVEGTSMMPSLADQERIFINRPGRHGGFLGPG